MAPVKDLCSRLRLIYFVFQFYLIVPLAKKMEKNTCRYPYVAETYVAPSKQYKTLYLLLFRVRISVMVGSTRSEKAEVENEERETAKDMVCKMSIVIIMKYH